MLNLSEYALRPRRLADYLPWACLVAPGIVLNKDGSFQATWRYRGPDLESSTEEELVAVAARVNNTLRRTGSGWAMFFEAVRQVADPYPPSTFTNPAAWLVDQERAAGAQDAGARFASNYFLTLLWLPPADASSRAERALIDRPLRPDADGWRERLDQFSLQCARLTDLLAGAFPEITPLTDDETLTYLHACVSSKHHLVRTPALPVFLDAVLADEAFTAGLEPMIGDVHIRTLTVLGFPPVTVPGLLDELNREGFIYRWVTRFIALDKSEAERLLSKKRRHWFAKRKSLSAVLRETLFNEEAALLDNDASNKAVDADAALQELGADLVGFGYVTTTITVMNRDRALVEEQLRAAERILGGRGFTAISETLNAAEAWLGSLPGHVYANVRQPLISTLNLSHLLPVSAVWAGEPVNSHLGGPALLEAQTAGTTPFRLNLHVGDVGHTMIIGPTGAGKSVLLSLIALQWTRYPGAQVFVFDKGRSARAAMLAMGGQHVELGQAEQSAFQPLRDIDTARGASFASDWLAGICVAEGVIMTPDLKSSLWEAIQALASAPEGERSLTGLCLLIQAPLLKAALHPFTLEGPYGRLLDGDTEPMVLSDLVCFELEDLMQMPAAAGPVLSYIFHRLEARFDGRPTLLILDEAWLFLDHPVFAARLRSWLKTLRKQNVAVVFATQSPADIETAAIAPVLTGSCPTRIFLPDERALEPGKAASYRRLGLNDRQIRILATATPKQDYYYTSPSGCRLFDLGMGDVGLVLCGSASPGDQALIDRILTEEGPGALAASLLREKSLAWAADLLPAWPGRDKLSPAGDLPLQNKDEEAPS